MLPQETFLGKYLIVDIKPYSKIIKDKLMINQSVFSKKAPPFRGGAGSRSQKGSVANFFQGSKVWEGQDIEQIMSQMHSCQTYEITDISHLFSEGYGILREGLYQSIIDIESKVSEKDKAFVKTRKMEAWLTPMHHLSVFSLNYAYRMKTEPVFGDKGHAFFDVFVLNDPNFAEFNLWNNFWRETLLIKELDDPRLP